MATKKSNGPKKQNPTRRRPAGQSNGQELPTKGGAVRTEENGDVLERGDIFFFYRPDVEQESPNRLLDVRRFHIVLRPEGRDVLRLITIGRKTLPSSDDGDRNHWGFVDRVFRNPQELREALSGAAYETETRGERHLPQARPAGEGVYALARAGRSSVLAYILELPEQPGEVQRAFHIEHEGQFVLSIKNPEAARPAGIGLDEGRRAEFPEELMERFGARKWIAADPPEFLDYEGAELVLIGGDDLQGQDASLGLEPEAKDQRNAEVFEVLKMDRSDRTSRPLFEGAWE
jgi:hypothetical protein